ncbi:MAG: hypothetical protein M5R36_09095 [Deltaproteobacteria bacterium]|nr:hypothetical protein [Deltaproteobacteria bacterium]
MSKSNPAPEPRSSTVCPGFTPANASGLPQPNDEAAASENAVFWSSPYPAEPETTCAGLPHPPAAGPQHPPPPVFDFFSASA